MIPRAMLFFGLLLASLLVHASDVYLLGEGRDNVMQKWVASRDQWRAQPNWTPSSATEPPLSVSKAAQIAETWLRKQHPDIARMTLSQVALRVQSSSGTGIEDRWFYRIEFQPIVAGKKVWGADLVAVVLLDGSVVVPKAEPYSSQRK